MTGAHDTVLDYADLFSVTLHDDIIQEFDIRWDEVLLSMSKIPFLGKSLEIEGMWGLINSKTVLDILRHGGIHQKISVQILTPGMGELNQELWYRVGKG